MFAVLVVGVPGKATTQGSGAGVIDVFRGTSSGLTPVRAFSQRVQSPKASSQDVTAPYGSSEGLTSTFAQRWLPGQNGLQTQHDMVFGLSLAAGDFNGDGDDELVVGSATFHHAGPGSIAVIPGTHRSGLTGSGDLLWNRGTAGIPGTPGSQAAWGCSTLAIGSFGHGRGEDLVVGDYAWSHYRGTMTVLYGSTTRNVGLRMTHAQEFNESTKGVPGAARANDQFAFALS